MKSAAGSQHGPDRALARPVAILAAMRRELATLEAQTEVSRTWRTPSFRAVHGRLDGIEVVLASTGEGAGNALRGAESLFELFDFERVIIVGVSGAISPSLSPGTLLAAGDVVETGAQVPPPPPEGGLLRNALVEAGAIPATFLSSRRILCTAREKAEAIAQLPPGTVAAVDLETAAFARAAGKRGLPYVAIRVVSDSATETLPMDFNALRDPSGALDGRRVALQALFRPWLIAPLWTLRARIRLCSDILARAVRATLAGETP
ncbi:MAG TPA: hypothetical protein VGR38_04645 [Candidatus Polarisedimenticolia bacterium]|nr:hypothetical protein [Candidatus Polarisedimenticolia bacterium]